MVKRLIYILLPLCMLACHIIPEDEQLLPVHHFKAKSNVLLVEFTGFHCVNCPNAAQEAHSLQQLFGDNLVVVEMHPASNSFCQTGKAEYDYTCPEADVYYKALGGTATTPFPTGVVNWTSDFLDYNLWSSHILTELLKEKEVSLHLTTTLKTDRTLSLQYEIDAPKTELQLCLWLVEDSIVGPQMMPNGSTNMYYTHNHVLRGTVFEGQPANTAHTLEYTVPDSINGQAIRLQHCAIVGVLMDAEQTVQDVQRSTITN